MAGTVSGGKLAAQTNTEKYGEDFYRRIGAMGGRKGTTGGFYANRELARRAGEKGGRISRRPKRVKEEAETPEPNNFKAGSAAIFRWEP